MTRRRGFTLTEILLTVSLLGVFLLLASRLITTNFHVAAQTLTADSNSARFDQATRMLRMDVSNSLALELSQSQLLRIHTRDDHLVEWQIDHNAFSRTDAKDVRTWNVGHPISLTMDGSVVLLRANPIDQIAMAATPTGATR